MKSYALLAGCAILGAGFAWADGSLPRIEAPTLTGRVVSLPADAKGQTSVVLLGFSKSAGQQAQDWVKQLLRDFHSNVGIYQVPVIEELPRFLRGLAQRQMRQITPQSLYEKVLLLDRGGSAWRQFLQHKNEDDIHVIVVDPAGQILHRYEGRFTEQAYRNLKPFLERTDQTAKKAASAPSASAQ